MDKNSIGLIGFGEVAYVFAKELTQKGITVYVYDHRFLEDSPKGRKKREKAEEIGVQQMHSVEQLVGCTPVILSTVVPAAAYDVAKAASAIVDERHMFIDMNSVNPKVKQEMADLFPDGSLFLDGVIMGAPKIRGLETLIYYSGRCPLISTSGPLHSNTFICDMSVRKSVTLRPSKCVRAFFQKGCRVSSSNKFCSLRNWEFMTLSKKI